MKRRRYLRAVGAAGAVGIAGCSGGGGGDGGDGGDDGDDTPEATADPVAKQIAVAVGRLNTAAIALADYQEQFRNGEDVTFAADRQDRRISNARDALSTAESQNPTQEQAAQIRGLRTVADALAAASDSVGDLRTASEQLDRVEPAIRDRNFSTASQRLSEPADRVASVDRSVSSARTSIEQLNADRMNATNLRFSELRKGIRELDELVGSFDTLLTGYEKLVAAGQSIQEARSQFRSRQYQAARDSLADADRQVQAAQSSFRTGRSDAPERLESRFDTALCQSVRLSDAIGLFDEAARTALAGDDPSVQRSEAVETLRSIEDC